MEKNHFILAQRKAILQTGIRIIDRHLIKENVFLGRFLITLVLTLLLSGAGYTQGSLNVNVQVQPPYSPYLNDYLDLANRTIITVTNTSNKSYNYFIKFSLTNNSNFNAYTKEDFKPSTPLTIGPGQTMNIIANESAKSSFNQENIELEYGNFSINDILRDGVLPDGKYSLCVKAYDYDGLNLISKENLGCSTFSISNLNAPVINDCNNKKFYYYNPQNLNLNWLPVTGNTQNKQILYDLYLSKIEEGDNPQDIIESGIATNAPNIIKVSNIPTTSFVYSGNYPHLEVGLYAWAVKARTSDGSLPIQNEGLSNVCQFSYEVMSMGVKSDHKSFVDCECKSTIPNDLSNIDGSSISIGTVVKSGKLGVTIKTISKNSNGFTGTGTVQLPVINSGLVKVNVTFENINIQRSGGEFYHTSGSITAVLDSKASFLPAFNPIDPGSLNLNPSQVQSLSSFFTTYSNQLISNIKKYPSTIAYNLPIGIDEKAMNIAITNLVLLPTQTYFDAVSILDIVDGNSKVALAGQGICVDNNSFCGEAKLLLIQDFNIPSIGITLKGGQNNDGTSLTFDKDGFKNLHIAASYTFPQGSLIDVKTNQSAKVAFVADTDSGWSDWVAEVQMDQFYMSGFPDMTFGSDNNTKIIYDHSDKRNPNGIPSPYTSADQSDQPIATNLLTWRGFYIPSIEIKLPASLTNANGQNLTVKAEKLIFDGGLSGNVSINNILSIGDGSLDGWYYSIDQFKLNIWKNTFKSSSLSGKIVLPISKDQTNTTNQLNYTCTLSKPANSDLDFRFEIIPDQNKDIAFNVLWAKCKLTNGTSIQISKVANNKFKAKAVLYGELNIETKIDNFPDINLAKVKFERLTFQSQQPYFSPGEVNACLFSMASPQHSLFGFSIGFDPTLGKGVSLYLNGNGANAELGLKLNAQLKLVKDVDFVPKADVTFNIFGKLRMNGIRPNWDGLGANISSIKLEDEAQIGPVGVKGELTYFNDNNGSYGFMGKLEMNIEKIVRIDAKAQFGYSANDGGFNYFFIDGMGDLGDAGIPMGPGLFMYGFGGGVFYNMTIQTVPMDGSNIKGKPNYVFDKNNPEPGVSLSGVKYTPQKGLFSVKASVLFGLATRAIFEADGSVVMSFNAQTGGVGSVMFQANGRFVSNPNQSLSERNENCMGKLDVAIEMNFDEKSFLFHAGIEAGVPTHKDSDLFYLNAQLNFFVGSSGWFIHVGRPWKDGNFGGGSPITLKVMSIFTFRSYFQCGTGTGSIMENGRKITGVSAVDPIPPIPNFIMDIINHNNRKGENGSVNSENVVATAADLKGGLAFGANFNTKLDATFLIFYINMEFMVGFDLAFYILEQGLECKDDEGNIMTKGVNGFYATGQVYLGAKIDVGIEIDLFFFSGKISIVEAGVAAYVKFGAPSPTYATGAIGGYFSILGGLIEGAFAVKFFWGKLCVDLDDESIDLIAEMNPTGDFDKKNYHKVVKDPERKPINFSPYVLFNYKINQTFLIIANAQEHDKDGNPADYRQYRYYHIRPEDIKIKLSGGKIFVNGEPMKNPLSINDFDISKDALSIFPKVPILFQKDTDFLMDVEARVKIFNLRQNSKGLTDKRQGYKSDGDLYRVDNFNREQWDYAKTNKDEVFVDERHVKFTTDCGIKYIENKWVTDVDPFHKTQNNPVGFSLFNPGSLRTVKSENSKYFIPFGKEYMASPIQTSIKNKFSVPFAHPILAFSLDNGYLGEDFICIPPNFKNNFDFKVKLTTFYNGMAAGNTINSVIYDAEILDGKSKALVKLTSDLPKNSFVIVQFILKRKSSRDQSSSLGAHLITKKTIRKDLEGGAKVDVALNSHTIDVQSKLKTNTDEIEMFRWYFTTGKYSSYRDKMANLTISVTQDTQLVNKVYGNSSFVGMSGYKTLASTYTFSGDEQFDFHDLGKYSLSQVFEAGKMKEFEKKLEDGYLGFAFDKASQQTVNDFLSTYFGNQSLLYNWTRSNDQIDKIVDTYMNKYITYKMLDVVKWDNVNVVGELLEPLSNLPDQLFAHGFDYIDLNKTLGKGEPLFKLQRTSRVFNMVSDKGKVIPSQIIKFEDIPKGGLPGNGPIILQSYIADAMYDFNQNVLNNVVNGFNPAIINNQSILKR